MVVDGPEADELPLPVRPKGSDQEVELDLHPVASRDALIVNIQPPKEPKQKINHVPCDIVLTIDVSYSMMSAAPVPGDDTSEPTGLTVLDLVKHAARTIIETLDEGDRLGIVTFSTDAHVVFPLTSMTEENKADARKKVDGMQPKSNTNLWHGLLESIKLFKDVKGEGQTRTMMVLTDGMPNHMCPRRGYGPKLKTMQPLPASIHTFGFGYDLKVGLLKAIAEVGGGNYAFIPDAGMIGTVFVHAVANLQSTFATNALLDLAYPKTMGLENAVGDTSDWQPAEEVAGLMRRQIPLGNLQYGQKRSLFLRVEHDGAHGAPVTASLKFQPTSVARTKPENPRPSILIRYCTLDDQSQIPAAEVAYCESRAKICEFITSLYNHNASGERGAPDAPSEDKKAELAELIRTIPAKEHSDEDNKSLLEDLSGADPKGQISLAVNNEQFFRRWGSLYLPSYLNAHTRQVCNSFKDPGPLRYGVDSPLFNACRDKLDNAFDTLPPPTPSAPAYTQELHRRLPSGSSSFGVISLAQQSAPISMSSYNRSMGPCFGGSTLVELSSGTVVEIRRLRRGMKVRTPVGPRKVAAVLRTPVEGQLISRMAKGSILVTPYHPISFDTKDWAFPADTAGRLLRYTGSIYSVMLQRDGNSAAHAVRLGGDHGLWGVTLGHGVTGSAATEGDVRAHDFLGNYDAVGRSLVSLGNWRKGVIVGGGVVRDYVTGMVCGFRRPRMAVKTAAVTPLARPVPRVVVMKKYL